MKKLLYIFFVALFTGYSSVESDVYVCKGGSSKRYHKSEKCRGLSNCSTKIYKISKAEAKKMNRTPCKIEYN